MTRAAVLRRLTAMQQGLSWTEAGRLSLADFDMLTAVAEQLRQAQQPAPSGRRSGGVTRTPIT